MAGNMGSVDTSTSFSSQADIVRLEMVVRSERKSKLSMDIVDRISSTTSRLLTSDVMASARATSQPSKERLCTGESVKFNWNRCNLSPSGHLTDSSPLSEINGVKIQICLTSKR